MLATPVTVGDAPFCGPRPINLSKDTRQVVELLNLTFGHRARRRLGEQVSLNPATPITTRWNLLSRSFVPGFVWEEAGKIVGNVTLIESQLAGRFLVANVAVHPDFQRRGIARSLMEETLNFIVQNRGHKILLQVEEDNEAAINLYRSLDYEIVGTMNHWHVTSSRLKIEKPPGLPNSRLRPIKGHDWEAAFRLDRKVVNPDLNWPVPPGPDLFKTGIWRRVTDFLNGQRIECWVVDKGQGESESQHLIGLSTLFSDWGRSHQIRLRVDPEWQNDIQYGLLLMPLTKLKKLRSSSAVISHPATDETANKLLIGANFQLRRSLTIMTIDVPGDQTHQKSINKPHISG